MTEEQKQRKCMIMIITQSGTEQYQSSQNTLYSTVHVAVDNITTLYSAAAGDNITVLVGRKSQV